jgi:NADH-quinone oxidoreductase subunit C
MSEKENEKKEHKPTAPKPTNVNGDKPKATPRPRPQVKKEEVPPEPSPKEPLLNEYKEKIAGKFGQDAIEEAYINRPNGHLPTLVVKKEKWKEIAEVLKNDPSFAFDYLENLSGVDYESHMEVVYHLYSFSRNESVCIKVKTDREQAEVPSVAEIWPAANWNEREAFDLLGIRFVGHPNLKRILLPDDWVGHPLRKDYVPLDKEV